MKRLYTLVLQSVCSFLLVFTTSAFAQPIDQKVPNAPEVKDEIPRSWQTTIQENLEKKEYNISFDQELQTFQSPNRANNIRAYYKPGQLGIKNRVDSLGHNWECTIKTTGIYSNDHRIYMPESDIVPVVVENNIEFAHTSYTEQYMNTKEGTRQNFIIYKAPVGSNKLTISLAISGLEVNQVNNDELHLYQNVFGKQEVRLVYKGLKAWDAQGRSLSGKITYYNGEIQLLVETTGAVFPITIDPIFSFYNSRLALGQSGAKMGWSVSSAGDVNNDGYSDVIVGSPNYDNGQTDEGVAFVYLGSSTGLGTEFSQLLERDQASAYYGFSVSSAGDVNADGYSDVLVGAPNYDNGQTDEGAVFLYKGSTQGLITKSAPQLIEYNQAYAYFGQSVSSAGNVNNDGYKDIIIGAPNYDGGQTDEGAAFIFRGTSGGVSSTPSRVLQSNQTYAYFGFSVSSAGDVNDDGFSDVIVGATNYNNGETNEGAAFVYHGSSGGIGTSANSLLESNQANAYLGQSVSSAGDVNGDGYDDVVVGAPNYDNGETDEGAAFVYHGSSSGISTTASSQLESNQANAYMGMGVSGAGDVNGDGYSDVIVGAYLYDNGETDEGAAFVYLGSLLGISTTVNTMFEGNQADAEMGRSVSLAGDINGDGYSDLIVGANVYDNAVSDEGAAFVFYGSSLGLNNASSTLEINQASAYLGWSVSSAGDVNGDGYSDVIVGAYLYDNGQTNEGAAFVYHGSSTGISDTVNSLVECNQASAYMGYSVSSAGDVNGDGFFDVIVGAYSYDTDSANVGAAFLYHGSATGLDTTAKSIMLTNQTNAFLGNSVSAAGDVNGDGYSDVIVGAYGYDAGQTDEGVAFVYHGSSTGIDTTAKSVVECNQASARMGWSVSSAGDVNGDGYSDVIVGAYLYNNTYTGEGATFVYHGSSTGIDATVKSIMLGGSSAYFGESVSSAGDVNGDGYSDVIVGAERYTNGPTREGAAFVYHGSSTGINTTAKSLVEGNAPGIYLGCSVSSAGDVNGDGFSDVIIGAYRYGNGETREGGAFIYHGSDTGLNTTVVSTMECNQTVASMGISVSSAGDVNGDGFSDVIVGAYLYDNGQTNEGAAFVYYGSPLGFNTTAENLLESNQATSYMGFSVSSAGDVNGDGYSDVIVGAPNYDNGQTDEGVALVYLGSSSGLVTTTSSLLERNQSYAAFGYSVSSAGDVNADGYSDVIVGAPAFDNSGQTNEGWAFVFHGSSTGISVSTTSYVESNQSNANLGFSVSSAGDVNGDGYSDVIVGAPGFTGTQSNEGAAFVYSGSSSGIITTYSSQLLQKQANSQLGFSVSSAGDVNGDSYSDVIVGAPSYDIGESNEGVAFVYEGSDTGVIVKRLNQMESNQVNAYLGRSVSSAGDVNGDGYSDVIVGAHLYDNGQTDEGAAFVYHGSSTGLIGSPSNPTVMSQLEVNEAGDWMGYSVSTAGDVNGDGYSDVIVGAPHFENDYQIEGAAYVYHGSPNGLNTNASAQWESDNGQAQMGTSVSAAGDVDGDGYSDVIVGAPEYTNGQTDEGAFYIYCGNNGGGVRNNLRLYDDDLSSLFTIASVMDGDMGIGLFAKSPQGRQKGKIVYETIEVGEAFSSASPITNSTQFTGQASGYSDLGLSGTELKVAIAKETVSTRVRARVKYDPSTSLTGQVYGPWKQLLINTQVASSGTPLPVELTFFTVKKQSDHTALLIWQTASELNNKGFEIQRLVSGSTEFMKIGEVTGAGTSMKLENYSFTDDLSLLTGHICYRLKQVDYNGAFDYSEVKCISKVNPNQILVYPNPTNGIVHIELPDREDFYTVHVLNLNGVTLIEKEIDSSSALDLSELKNGMYILKGYSKTQMIISQKLMIEK